MTYINSPPTGALILTSRRNAVTVMISKTNDRIVTPEQATHTVAPARTFLREGKAETSGPVPPLFL